MFDTLYSLLIEPYAQEHISLFVKDKKIKTQLQSIVANIISPYIMLDNQDSIANNIINTIFSLEEKGSTDLKDFVNSIKPILIQSNVDDNIIEVLSEKLATTCLTKIDIYLICHLQELNKLDTIESLVKKIALKQPDDDSYQLQENITNNTIPTKTFSWAEKYKVVYKITETNQAITYKVKDLQSTDDFVLKQLKYSEFTQQSCIDTLKKNIRMSTSYTSTLSISDHSLDDYWYTTPIAENISDYITKKQCNLEEIIDIFIDLAEELKKIHEKKDTHCNIKPSNIIVLNNRFYYTDAKPHDLDIDISESQQDDVRALAISLWCILSGNKKFFKGTYIYDNPQIGLSFIPKLKDSHISEIEQLLKEATEFNPKKQFSTSHMLRLLDKWKLVQKDYPSAQRSDWDFLKQCIFPTNTVPEELCWTSTKDIIFTLNALSISHAYNHMMLANGGGLDFKSSAIASDNMSIYLNCDLGKPLLITPSKLHFVSFQRSSWNYFYLETKKTTPYTSHPYNHHELLIEDTPNHFIPDRYSQYGVYDYDSGEPLPEGYKCVDRYIDGNFLIVLKDSEYNRINIAYDAIHDILGFDEFKRFMETLYDLFNTAEDQGIPRNEIPDLLNNIFNLHKDTNKIKKRYVSEYKDVFLKNYNNYSFSHLLPEATENNNLLFYIILNSNNITLDNIPNHFILGKNGLFKETSFFKIPEDTYPFDNRDICIKTCKHIQEFLHNESKKQIDNNTEISNDILIEILLSPQIIPEAAFTEQDIELLIRNADDRIDNMLVIDENGKALMLSGTTLDKTYKTYPVRYERFVRGNVYVGKYSHTKSKYIYDDLIKEWENYKETKTSIYIDY